MDNDLVKTAVAIVDEEYEYDSWGGRYSGVLSICPIRMKESGLKKGDLLYTAPLPHEELFVALKEMLRTEMFLPDHPQRQAARAMAVSAVAKTTQKQ